MGKLMCQGPTSVLQLDRRPAAEGRPALGRGRRPAGQQSEAIRAIVSDDSPHLGVLGVLGVHICCMDYGSHPFARMTTELAGAWMTTELAAAFPGGPCGSGRPRLPPPPPSSSQPAAPRSSSSPPAAAAPGGAGFFRWLTLR